MKKIHFLLSALMLISLMSIAATVVSAATFTVTNADDSGAGSLRQAVLDANGNNEADTIVFDPGFFNTPRTITLTSGQIMIAPDNSSGAAKSLTINGPGANLLTLSGNNQSRIFYISMHSVANLNNLKLTAGNGVGTFINNSGGAIITEFSVVNLNGLYITGNSAAYGGGIYNGYSDMTIVKTTVANNRADLNGGGIYSGGAAANMKLINSTVSDNRATSGCGIYNGRFLELTNTTIAYNACDVTIYGNGGGIYVETFIFPAYVMSRNSIFANNKTPEGISPDVYGGVISKGYNIFGSNVVVSGETAGNQINVDPQLNPNLSFDGGAIPTHALRANSPAIDKGNDCVLTTTANGGCVDPNITTDSRNVARPQDGDGDGTATVDIGAFEATRAEVVISPTAAPDLDAADDSGISSTDNVTSKSNLTFSVPGLINGAAVELLRDGLVIATATVSGNSVVLSDNNLTANGVHAYTSRQTVNNVTSLQSSPLLVTFDNIAPAITLNQASWQADPTNAQPINYTVAFSETVTGFEPSDVSLAGSTAGVSNATVAVSGSGAAYTIGVINLSADGTVVASIPAAGAALDIAGNPSLPSTSTDNTVTYDTTRPTVTINQAGAQTDPTRTLPVNFTVVFSEPVTGFAAADVTLAGSTANVSSASITVTGSGTTYNVAVGGIFSNGGFVRAGVVANATADAAGNLSLVSTSTDNQITVDNASPSVTINQAAGQADPTNALPINFTVVFSEPVTGFDAADIFFSGSVNTLSATVTVTAGSNNTTYNVSVGGNITANNRFLRASVRDGAASDSLGNLSFASTSTDNQVTIDNVAPSVTINQASGQSDPASTQPVNFTVVFNELVTGFNASDVSLAGSTANVSSANVSVTGSGSVYNVAVSNITSSGQVRASVPAAAAQDSLGNLSNASTSSDNTITVNLTRPAAFDYDGDGKADLSVFRPSAGYWYINNSLNNSLTATQFGASGDLTAPADYDGDGKTDICVFRPADGGWYRLNSSNNTFTPVQFGTSGDLPVPGDFDGDGKADLTVYRPSAGSWYRINSSNNQFVAAQFGIAEDKPLVGDFDGDGKSDLTVFRPSNGTWYRINSATDTFSPAQFGASGDLPVAADYDGDGKTDLAVYRPSVGDWYIINSSNSAFISTHFGVTEDKPAPADFDGDGKADLVVFRPSSGTWYLLRTTAGFTGIQFGADGDIPTSGAFVR